jgi:hypothetical protein
VNRLCLSTICALSLALAAGCATGEAPAGPVTDNSDTVLDGLEVAPVIELEDRGGRFDRFDEVWVEVSGVELLDENGRWDAVDAPPDVIQVNRPVDGFGSAPSHAGYTRIRLTVSGGFVIDGGVAEDLSIDPFAVVTEVGEVARIDL